MQQTLTSLKVVLSVITTVKVVLRVAIGLPYEVLHVQLGKFIIHEQKNTFNVWQKGRIMENRIIMHTA